VGDLVKLDALGKANIMQGTFLASDLTNVVGAVVGIEPVNKTTTSVQGASLSLEQQYIPKAATGTRYVRVCTDPTTIYEAVIGGTGTIVGDANIGHTMAILALAGGSNIMAKQIGSMVLDVASASTGANMFQVIGIPNYPDNELSSANTRVHVVLQTAALNRGYGAR
jgi:hypothetical protein